MLPLMRQVEQQILCPCCGEKGHAKKDCWKWQRERGGKGDCKGTQSFRAKSVKICLPLAWIAWKLERKGFWGPREAVVAEARDVLDPPVLLRPPVSGPGQRPAGPTMEPA